ncbi:MAG TPA: DUF2235 domain-containing protein [Ramlibacter sp.]|nr:DUF2235 domain-containing protein [Ramlibacter sp.]
MKSGPTLRRDAVTSARRLVILLDGTWNKRQDTTNVWRMRLMLRHAKNQRIYYDEGVGTARGEQITGGAFASGLSGKVLNAYLWLLERYEDQHESPTGSADEVYVFGFSRGAFAARSLVGLLAISGLLRRDAATRVVEAFELARLQGLSEHSPIARQFRTSHSREIRIKFLGVWDTVGALGVPRFAVLNKLRLLGFEQNDWHKVVQLPSIVEHARHAMAIDERRELFKATLWPKADSKQTMEQRWFIGAHANVGGGYGNDWLFRRPLQWLQVEASVHGLDFRQVIHSLGDLFYRSPSRDSLGEVMYGLYHLSQLHPHVRPIGTGKATRETIDFSALERWIWNPWYRPPALESILRSKPNRRPASPQMNDRVIQGLVGVPSSVNGTRGFTFP